jgi:two-component system, OmpR family, sensor histidine kinase VanS
LKNDFGRLKGKIILWVVLTTFIALLAGALIMKFLVDGFLQAPFADLFIGFCQRILRLDYQSAQLTYASLFRQNKSQLMLFGFCIILMVSFYLSLSRFTRYFNEVSRGLDRLVEESQDEITLSREMDFMEKKLNTINNTLKKRRKDAQEAEQRKNDLVVYLAHDIKTPLTSVIGYLSLLDEAPDMPAVQKVKYVGITLEKAYRLEQLINEFFEITRFNLNTMVLDKKEINLPFMLAQMADEFYPILEPQGKKVEVDNEEQLNVYGDADKLARVFNNILKNASAYSHENSTIQIGAKHQKDAVVITFSNQGETIPKSKLDTIFEKFYRLDNARSTNSGGAGLGLAIAREIINAHGGTISAQSSDNLTSFTVTLPLSL